MAVPSPVFTLRSAKGEVTCLTFVTLSRKEKLITGHSSGELQLWDLETNRPVYVWCAHNTERVRWVGFSDGQLFSYGADSNLIFWIIERSLAKKIGSLSVNSYTHCPCDITSQVPTLLAIPDDTSDIGIISAEKQQKINTLRIKADEGKHGVLMCVKFAEMADKTLLLASYENGSVILWDIAGKGVLSYLKGHPEPMTCIDFHVTSMCGISGFADDKLLAWYMTEKFELHVKGTVFITNPGVACVKTHSNGLYTATGGWDGRIRIFSWKKLKPLAVLDFHSETVQCLAISQETRCLAAGSKDGRISFWNLYNK